MTSFFYTLRISRKIPSPHYVQGGTFCIQDVCTISSQQNEVSYVLHAMFPGTAFLLYFLTNSQEVSKMEHTFMKGNFSVDNNGMNECV